VLSSNSERAAVAAERVWDLLLAERNKAQSFEMEAQQATRAFAAAKRERDEYEARWGGLKKNNEHLKQELSKSQTEVMRLLMRFHHSEGAVTLPAAAAAAAAGVPSSSAWSETVEPAMSAMEKHATEQRRAYDVTASKNKGKFYRSGQVWRIIYNHSENRPAKSFKESLEVSLSLNGVDPPSKAVYLREARHWDSFYIDKKATEKTKPRDPATWKIKESGFNLVAILLFNEPVGDEAMQACLDALQVRKVPGTLIKKKEDFLWRVIREYKKPNDKNGKEFTDFIWGKGTASSDREAHRHDQIGRLESLQTKLIEGKDFTGAQNAENEIRDLKANLGGQLAMSQVAEGVSSSSADVAMPVLVNVLPSDEDGDGREAQSISQTEKVMSQMRDGFHTAATHLLAADLGLIIAHMSIYGNKH